MGAKGTKHFGYVIIFQGTVFSIRTSSKYFSSPTITIQTNSAAELAKIVRKQFTDLRRMLQNR